MELVYYTPNKLYSYSEISQRNPLQVSFSQMFNASISLIDRSGLISCPPIPVRILDPILSWDAPSDFASICHDRFDEILRETVAQNKTLVIFYSGGIDSTLIAALAIAHPKFESMKKNGMILLALSEDSIKENPRFWREHLQPAFGNHIASSAIFHNLISCSNNICLTGEFADNIFGSLTLKSYMDNTGDTAAIHKDFRSTGMEWLLKKITNQGHRDACVDLMDTIFSSNPAGCRSNHDCFWWLNFVLKWQAVKLRLISHAPSAAMVDAMSNNVIHFFETKRFQDWAVLTNETKVENEWYSYKLPAKKLIYDINKDGYYFKWKTKYPSIPSLTRYTNMHDFIYYDDAAQRYVASKILLDRATR